MKRNFGSLNLAALDLNRSASSPSAHGADCSFEDRFSAMDPGADDCRMDAGFVCRSDENVGYPLERIPLPATDVSSPPPHSSCREALPHMDKTGRLPELSLPICSPSVMQLHRQDSDVRQSELLHPLSSETPQHLHDQQQQVELKALRCLSLKVMLSNLSTSNNSNNSISTSANASVASNKPNYTYPGVNDRAKTALLPLRHPSLQSV